MGVGVNYKGGQFKTLFGVFITLANILFAAEFVFVTVYDTYNRTAYTASDRRVSIDI